MVPPLARASTPNRLLSWVLAAAIGAVLTALLTWPTVRDFGSAARLDSSDGRFSVWNVGWVAHAIVDDPVRLFDANIFHPHPGTLTYSELNLVAGAAGAPIYALTRNPVAAHNGAVVLGLFFAFLTSWALVTRLTGSFGAGVVAGAGYSFCAYVSAHTAHVQLLMIFGFPLTMLAFHRLARRPTLLAGVWLGAALALTALASAYYGVFAIGLVGAATLLWAQRTRAYWIAVGVAALTAAVLVLPVVVPALQVRAEAGPSRLITPDELRAYSANWPAYASSATWLQGRAMGRLAALKQSVWPHAEAEPLREVLFPGFVISAMAIVGLAAGLGRSSDRGTVIRYAVVTALAAWASSGPDGGFYTLLSGVLPGSGWLRAPARLGVVVMFGLAVLAGFGVARLGQHRRWLAPALMVLVAAELWVAWPLAAMPPRADAYGRLRALPRGGVVEFPFPYIRSDLHQHTRAMVRAMDHWQPLVNGYSDFIPADFREIAEPINGFPDARSFEIMRARDVRYVVLRAGDYGPYRERLLARFSPYEKHLRLLTNDQDVWLYEIVSWPHADGSPPVGNSP